jgi:O-antigen/teichoic acid export membrane protein
MSKTVIKNFSLLTISNFINQFVLVVSGVKIARTLGPTSYGIYTYLFVEKNLYAVISDLGIRNIVIRKVAREATAAKDTFFAAIALQFIGLLLGVSIMLIYESYTHSILPELIIFIILAVFLNNLWGTCESIWQGHQRMGPPAFINVFYSVIWVIFILIVPATSFTVEFLFKYYIYIQILQIGHLLLITFFTKGILIGQLSNTFSSLKDLFKESWAYYFNNLMVLPTSSLSNNFLERNSTKAQLGYFNTSNRLIAPINLVITLGLSALFPNLSALWTKDKNEMLKRVTSGFPLYIIIFGSICFCFSLISKELITILFGGKFLPSVAIIQFQIWFVFIFALNCFIGTIWGATDNQKLLVRCSVINTLIATPMLLFGSKFDGLGLAYAYLIAYAVFFPIVYTLFIKSLNLKMNVANELGVVSILFVISAVLPINTSIYIRIAIIIFSLLFIYKFYGNKILAFIKKKTEI